jgi:hypothetical protein
MAAESIGCPFSVSESAFHNAGFRENLRISIISLFEKWFCIAKIAAYLFEI